jgi:hypothetical protein
MAVSQWEDKQRKQENTLIHVFPAREFEANSISAYAA